MNYKIKKLKKWYVEKNFLKIYRKNKEILKRKDRTSLQLKNIIKK